MKGRLTILLLFISTITVFAHKDKWDDNKKDWTDLMVAIYDGQTDMFIKLIKHGANINFVTKETSLTALEVALRKNNKIAVK